MRSISSVRLFWEVAARLSIIICARLCEIMVVVFMNGAVIADGNNDYVDHTDGGGGDGGCSGSCGAVVVVVVAVMMAVEVVLLLSLLTTCTSS